MLLVAVNQFGVVACLQVTMVTVQFSTLDLPNCPLSTLNFNPIIRVVVPTFLVTAWARGHIICAQISIPADTFTKSNNNIPLCDYRERKVRRNMLTTNPLQGEVRCCQI